MARLEALAETVAVAILVAQPKLSSAPSLVGSCLASLRSQSIDVIDPKVSDHWPGAIAATFADVQFETRILVDVACVPQGSHPWNVHPVLGEPNAIQDLGGMFDAGDRNHGND